MTTQTRTQSRARRHKRVRAKISGTEKTPRLAVYRSNKHLSVQLIDDATGKILASIVNGKKGVAAGTEMGKSIAEKAREVKIKKAVFDRGGYAYHGSVKAIAEAAREAGLAI